LPLTGSAPWELPRADSFTGPEASIPTGGAAIVSPFGGKGLQFRLETFNVFNHTQFLDRQRWVGLLDRLVWQVEKAAPPRLVQLAVKYTF